MAFIQGNSHNERIIEKVKDKLGGDKVDFLFIDGDHSYEGVKQDFEMYSDLVSSGGIIAFHDIVEHTDDKDKLRRLQQNTSARPRHLNANTGVEVHKFWEEIKDDYRTKEIISNPNQTWAGVGIIYKGDD